MITPKEVLNHVLPPDFLNPSAWTAVPDAPDLEGESDGAARIAIVGQAGVGKKTLCNTLWGWDAVSADGESVRHFGRLTLIDLPADTARSDEFLPHLSGAQMIMVVVDAAHGLNDADFRWVSKLRAANLPIFAAANKVDLLDSPTLKKTLALLRERLGIPVIPVIAVNLLIVHHHFLPAVLKAFPDTAEALASEITGLRQRVARQMTMRAAINSLFFSVRSESEGEQQQDVALLVSVQMRLMRRIGMLYGYRPRGGHGRELALTVGLRFLLRRAVWMSSRYPALRAWMLSSTVAVVTTILVGRFAVIYYSASLPGWMRWL